MASRGSPGEQRWKWLRLTACLVENAPDDGRPTVREAFGVRRSALLLLTDAFVTLGYLCA